MCGITVVAHLAGRSKANKSAINGAAAGPKSKKRKLSNGVFGPNGPYSTSIEDQLDSSLDAIKHRGPDSHGTWISHDGHVGM